MPDFAWQTNPFQKVLCRKREKKVEKEEKEEKAITTKVRKTNKKIILVPATEKETL